MPNNELINIANVLSERLNQNTPTSLADMVIENGQKKGELPDRFFGSFTDVGSGGTCVWSGCPNGEQGLCTDNH